MNHLEDILLIPEWKVMEFGEYSIPSSRMKKEMVYPHKINLDSDAYILNNYLIYEKMDINKYFKDYPMTEGGNVADIPKDNPQEDFQSLHAFRLLNYYRSSKPKYFQESLLTIIEYSNCIISALTERPYNELLYKFCTENNISYSQYKYHSFVADYCLEMLPYPLRNIISSNDEYNVRNIIEGKFNEVTKYPGVDIAPPNDETTNRLLSKNFGSDRSTILRFSEYANSRKFLTKINFEFPDELKKVRKDNFEGYYESVGEKKKQTRSGFSDQHIYLTPYLCQCQFCYRYRFEPPSGNKIAWHCGDPECKDIKYKAWNKMLLNRGIKLKNVLG
jgi:hypothetical protein